MEAIKQKVIKEIEESLEEFRDSFKRHNALKDDSELISFAEAQIEFYKMRDRMISNLYL